MGFWGLKNMKNELIEIGKTVFTAVLTKLVLDLIKKMKEKRKETHELEIEYKTTIKIVKSAA